MYTLFIKKSSRLVAISPEFLPGYRENAYLCALIFIGLMPGMRDRFPETATTL